MLGGLHTYGRELHDLERALDYFDDSFKELRNEAALLHKAQILDAMGRRDQARQAYEEILSFNKDHPRARRKLPHYRAGQG